MTRFITSDRLKKALASIGAAIFWLAVWQAAYLKVAQELLLVSPAQAFSRLFLRAGEVLFWQSVWLTCFRVVMGFLLALLCGAALAMLCARFAAAQTLLSPLFGVVRATPVASFIILALLWFSSDRLPIFIAFLMVVPMIWSNIYTGIRETDSKLLEMAKVFRLGPVKIFKSIYVPSVTPHFLSACSVGLGFAWKSAIAAEIICLPRDAIGKQLNNAKIYLETADLFAWTIAVIILSVLIEKLTLAALRALSKRLAATGGEGGRGIA